MQYLLEKYRRKTMIKQSIGIDIGSCCLRAVQVSQTDGQFRIEKVFSTPVRRSADFMPDMLTSLVKQHGFDRHADVAISMQRNTVFFRNLTDYSVSEEQNYELAESALEYNFPIQPDEIVAQACSYHQLPGEKYSVLTAAVARESLHERINTLAGTKMYPALVDTTIFAVHSVVTVNHPEIATGQAIIVYIDECCLTLAITQNNNILIVRNIPIISPSEYDTDSVQEQIADVLSREAQITWQKVFGGTIEEDTKIYMATGENAYDNLEMLVEESLHCQIIPVNPYAMVENLSDYNGDASICVAEGLALRALAPEETTGVNFIKADNADVKPALDLKKEFTICVILVAAIAVISLAGLFMRLSHLETKYTHIKNESKEIFQQALPEEKNIVNPLAQLEQKLQFLQKDYMLFGPVSGAAIGPAEILYAITKNLPSGVNISIESMLITTESVRLAGTSQSFESIYSWQRLLQNAPQFSAADVQDIQREPNSKLIRFSILLSLETME